MKIKFYTEEEMNFLLPAIEGKVELDEKFLNKASKMLKRPAGVIRSYIYCKRYSIKKKNENNNKNGNDPIITKSSFRQGEFVIPISNWEIKTSNGVTQLIFKFGKNVK